MTRYEELDFRTFKINDEDERTMLSNFTARIVKETRIVDGLNSETFLTVEGWAANAANKTQPFKMQAYEVPAASFASMSWVMSAWGVRAVISPGNSIKDDLRMAIQMNSNPERVEIYKSIGWTRINDQHAYLHAGGAITAHGNDPKVAVRLPMELQRYDLSKVKTRKEKEAFLASLDITSIAAGKIAWPVWCATWAPLFGPVDFAIHITGRSGTFKSEFCSLFQSHYGEGMDARHLPGSWSSTPNALEAQAYYAANAVFVVDDFVPCGTSWQVRAYQTGADKLIRGQGNQAGRARLTDTSGMQTTYYPRGIILSTGEDTPEGHSVRARMLIIEISPGDIKIAGLTDCQKNRELFVTATADLVQSIACGGRGIEKEVAKLRDKLIKIGHTRTPAMLGRLIATGQTVLKIACEKGYIGEPMRKSLEATMSQAIIDAGNDQMRHLEASDPIEIFFMSLRQVLSAGHGHIRTRNGGIPLSPTTLGWSSEKSSGSMETYKSHGPCIGWIDWDDDELYLEADNGFAMVKKIAGQELSLSKQTVWKRLKDAGMLLRSDDTRQRNTIRVTAEGHQRQVVALAASHALDVQEKPVEKIPD